jgi:hypothetical protein
MCEYLGYEVTALKRIRINISLDIPVGRYRDLTEAEIKELNELIEPSSKTEASLPKPEAPKRRNEFIKKRRSKIQEKRRLLVKDKKAANTIYSFYFQTIFSFYKKTPNTEKRIEIEIIINNPIELFCKLLGTFIP